MHLFANTKIGYDAYLVKIIVNNFLCFFAAILWLNVQNKLKVLDLC